MLNMQDNLRVRLNDTGSGTLVDTFLVLPKTISLRHLNTLL